MATSWKPEVIADGTGRWYGYALCFATEQEAIDQARDLAGRWMAVREYRAVPSDDPPNHRWVDGRLVPLEGV